MPFLFIQHCSGEAEEMSWTSHQVREWRTSQGGNMKMMSWCVVQMWLRCCTNRSRRPYIFRWLFPFVALRRVTAQAAVHISQTSTLLPFIVSGASITWKHEAEGPNMQAGDDGILNKCCNWAPGPFFMCCVYLLRPDGRFTRTSVQWLYLELVIIICCVWEFDTCDECRIKTGCHWLLGQIYSIAYTLWVFQWQSHWCVVRVIKLEGKLLFSCFPNSLVLRLQLRLHHGGDVVDNRETSAKRGENGNGSKPKHKGQTFFSFLFFFILSFFFLFPCVPLLLHLLLLYLPFPLLLPLRLLLFPSFPFSFCCPHLLLFHLLLISPLFLFFLFLFFIYMLLQEDQYLINMLTSFRKQT